jgi:hypothetical protein
MQSGSVRDRLTCRLAAARKATRFFVGTTALPVIRIMARAILNLPPETQSAVSRERRRYNQVWL